MAEAVRESVALGSYLRAAARIAELHATVGNAGQAGEFLGQAGRVCCEARRRAREGDGGADVQMLSVMLRYDWTSNEGTLSRRSCAVVHEGELRSWSETDSAIVQSMAELWAELAWKIAHCAVSIGVWRLRAEDCWRVAG